jgi:polysaccharide chain length determinant protein (PEP-CTERM system associated)
MSDPRIVLEDMGAPPQGAVIERLRTAWGRRKWLALVMFVVPLAASLSLVVFLPDVYKATATVLVERQQVPEAFVRSTVTGEMETRLQSISQEILSRSRLEALIQRFGLYAGMRQRGATGDEMVERMRKDILLETTGASARGRGATIAFTVSYRGSDPQTVALVTNTLASFYIEEDLRARSRQASGTTAFLGTQLAETKRRLDEQEGKVGEFKRRAMGELPQQIQSNLAALESLNNQLRLNAENQVRTLARREALSKDLNDLIASGGGPEPAAVRLARLKGELAELRTRYTDRWPDIIRIKDEIAKLETEMAKPKPESTERATIPDTPQARQLVDALRQTDLDIKGLRLEDRRLRALISSYQARVENTPRREQELQDISRDYDSTKGLYESLLKRFEEAQIAESMEQRQKGEQFRILDPALPPREPDAPKRSRLVLVGLALSLGLAAGAVLISEKVDTTFHSIDDLRAFSRVPVLVSIPRIISGGDRRRQRRRVALGAAGAAVLIILVVAATYLIAQGTDQLVQALSGQKS